MQYAGGWRLREERSVAAMLTTYDCSSAVLFPRIIRSHSFEISAKWFRIKIAYEVVGWSYIHHLIKIKVAIKKPPQTSFHHISILEMHLDATREEKGMREQSDPTERRKNGLYYIFRQMCQSIYSNYLTVRLARRAKKEHAITRHNLAHSL